MKNPVIKRKSRKLLNGSRVKEAIHEVEWSFESKCPDKWIHIDCEEGYIYVTSNGEGWKAATHNQLKSALIAIKREDKRRAYERSSKVV